MKTDKVYRAIGLMSGTSLDGEIDVALIETDGVGFVKPIDFTTYVYDGEVGEIVRACFGKKARDEGVDKAERLVTDVHIDAVKASGFEADIIGFHGQTITHDPDNAFTWQIGDGKRLAEETGIPVVADMRQNDIRNGGQGAPLLPLYHKAMMAKQDQPALVLNLGGVANLTYIEGDDLIAFDCGPANALMDDFIRLRIGQAYDADGVLAASGKVNSKILDSFLADSYFRLTPPKSLDRNQWSIDLVQDLSDSDGIATLMAMSVGGVVKAIEHLLHKPRRIYVCGGGAKNGYFLQTLSEQLNCPVMPLDDLGWNGDATEAEGFAYLAVRSLLGLSLTLPSTTGVTEALSGGARFKA